MANGQTRVALAQIDVTLGSIDENIERARDVIAEARAQRADLVVFPELSLTGFSVDTSADGVALAADDPRIPALASGAGQTAAVVGFVEQGAVHVHNSTAYVDDGRVVHVQRKLYLPTYGPFEEHKRFSPGRDLSTFDASAGRLAVLICNDAWQPPLPFLAVQDGAQALIVTAASGLTGDEQFDATVERDWDRLLHFHARFLECYVIFVNRAGAEPGLAFWGGSRVIDPWGATIAQAPGHETALLTVELDLSAVHKRRREMPLVKEPRLDLLSREFARVARTQP